MILKTKQIDELKEFVNDVLEKLYKHDKMLIEIGGMERSLTFRFGLYFCELIKQSDWLEQFDIDLEYNKNISKKKQLPMKPGGVRPDLILHKRGENEHNILVIEFKGWWNDESRENDRIKLEDFVSQSGEYKYGLGVLVELNKDEPELKYYFDY